MTENYKDVLSPDYYSIITDPNSKIIVNDIRFIKSVLITIDNKFNEYQTALRQALIKAENFKNLDKNISADLYSKITSMMNEKKEKLKKDILVSGHIANISRKTTVRTAVVFYNNLKAAVSQQLDLAFSLILSRLEKFYEKE